MKYKDLVDEILDHSDDSDQLSGIMDLVIGKAINQERIQIYKTLAIYFSELTEKNKGYLVEKIKANQVILDDRCAKLASNDIFTNTNDFFDLQEGMEQIRIDKNLMKQYGTIAVDELVGERPPTRDGGLFVTANAAYNTAMETRTGYTITATTNPNTVPTVGVDVGGLRRVQTQVNEQAAAVAMERGRQMEQRVMATLQELAIDPATLPLDQVNWVTLDDGLDDLFEQEEFEDEQE